MQFLTAYDWPGNVRELENAIEAATVLADDTIEANHLPSAITTGLGISDKKYGVSLPNGSNLDCRLQELEKGIIIDALIKSSGVQKRAAAILGIKERSLWHRIKKYDIDAAPFKHKYL
jgi:DNA-binding NtrC family response regulator